jgi:hypothetical protein
MGKMPMLLRGGKRWGNTLGWIISGALAIGMSIGMWFLVNPPSGTDAIDSPALKEAMKTIALKVSPDKVVTPGTQDGDAGKNYHEAMDEVKAHHKLYEDYIESHDKFKREHGKEDVAVFLVAVADVLKARDCKNCNGIFSDDPSQLVNYHNSQPALDDLYMVGDICVLEGMRLNPKVPQQGVAPQPEKAMKLWEAAFVLGVHLYDERLTSKELEAGDNLMRSAATQLQRYWANDPRAAAAVQFLTEQKKYEQTLANAYHILGALDESLPTDSEKRILGDYAGDIIRLAGSSQADPMFRVEALLHIGRYKYACLTKGDQAAGKRMVKKILDDASTPPSVKAAANAAQNLTKDDFDKIGGNV